MIYLSPAVRRGRGRPSRELSELDALRDDSRESRDTHASRVARCGAPVGSAGRDTGDQSPVDTRAACTHQQNVYRSRKQPKTETTHTPAHDRPHGLVEHTTRKTLHPQHTEHRCRTHGPRTTRRRHVSAQRRERGYMAVPALGKFTTTVLFTRRSIYSRGIYPLAVDRPLACLSRRAALARRRRCKGCRRYPSTSPWMGCRYGLG